MYWYHKVFEISIRGEMGISIEIRKVYKESFPALRFIGKRYTDKDDIGAKWGEWHQNGWFDEIETLGASPENDDAYLGAKRIQNGELEYWIGMFFPAGTNAPEGFVSVDIAPLDVATCWVYGNDPGELSGFDAHNQCLAELPKHNFVRKEDDWCFERYNCPRFISPDEQGNVILDYCISIEHA